MLHVTLDNSGPAIGLSTAIKLLGDDGVTAEQGSAIKATYRENAVESPALIMKLLTTKSSNLVGSSPLEKTEIDQYIFLAEKLQGTNGSNEKLLTRLDKDLRSSSYLVGQRLTYADLAVYGRLVALKDALGTYTNLKRYFGFIDSLVQDIQAGVYNPVLHFRSVSDNGAGDAKQVSQSDNGSQKNQEKPQKGGGKKEKKNDGGRGNKENSPSKTNRGGGDKPKDQGKFVELPGAVEGEVVVRFPPEASGYLHIGHAKAALLNQHYQHMFKGKLIMRFDDTNPAKENPEFEKVILGDLQMLEIKPDRFTYTSDYFDLMLELCEKMIKEGKAFIDDTDPELMKQERAEKIESKNRNNSVEKNLELWDEMKRGTQAGQKCCVRAKIDMNSLNGCMRDPTIYRCKPEHHPRTGDKYKVYPTYDFACPIVDSIEGVTHALRTTEYHDRDDQFFWFIDALQLRKPYIYEYSRLNLTNTVLSKRKLTWFVDQGLVDGWDDPRFPTVRGVLRRGMTVEGLKQFIVAQGSSKSVVMMEWDKIWAFNRKVIDPTAPRHTALTKDSRVTLNIKGNKEESKQVAAHPKNPEIGTRTVWTAPQVLVEEDDAVLFKEGENVTLINWGNIRINKVNRDSTGRVTSIDGETNLTDVDFKNTLKVTWLPATVKSPLTPIVAVHFDHIISKPVLAKDEDFKQYIGKDTRIIQHMVGDSDLVKVKKGDIIQLQRKGFFICDEPCGELSSSSFVQSPLVLFAIPDGHTKVMPTAKVPNKAQESKQTSKLESASAAQAPATANSTGGKAEELSAQIDAQGNKVRDLKAAKAAKDVVTAAVKILLDLKANYKNLTGQDYVPGVVKPAQTAVVPPASTDTNGEVIRAQVDQQGNKIRDLKASKAAKDVITAEVKKLLELKTKYKEVTGQEYVPGQPAPAPTTTPAPVPSLSGDNKGEAIQAQVDQQGNKIRDLKASKAAKDVITAEVKKLLELKAKYKEVTGKDYSPGATPTQKPASEPPAAAVNSGGQGEEIQAQVDKQGNKIRDLKAAKAAKSVIAAEVKTLLELKTKYKEVTGQDYVPGATPVSPHVQNNNPTESPLNNKGEEVRALVDQQGNKIRDLKAAKAAKDVISAEVKVLLELKAKYKEVTGKDYTPGVLPPPVKAEMTVDSENNSTAEGAGNSHGLKSQIEQQGNKVRDLKSSKAGKAEVDAAVKQLLELKTKYKEVTGEDFVPAGGAGGRSSGGKKESKKEVKPVQTPVKAEKASDGNAKKQTRLGLEVKKADNFSEWYSQVITKSEMIEYYDVSGCYIFRPWSYAVWELIMGWFDGEIKKLGVQNTYFPMFVSQSALEREKNHIADFAPEVAWVTKSGDSDLAEPVAIRPTSETVMYPSYAKWIQSYRDLPLKLNQWNSVVRWEFKHPQPFLRTREFLWQEGHSAFATYKEAEEEVHKILDLYEKIYTYLMAVPVIPGRKSEKEKFPGGDYTLTVEAFIPTSGRGLQGATSHHLGQNFSKMFEIVFEDPETQQKQFVYQNSWGLSTRTIGAMVMIHGDDQGLVLPPRLACIQVVIIPCGITVNLAETERKNLYAECQKFADRLVAVGVRIKVDDRDNYSPGWKFNHWELKGVPIRLELGPKDLKENQYVVVRRDNGNKSTLKSPALETDIRNLLETIHDSMFNRVKEQMDAHTIVTEDWKQFCSDLDKKNILMSPFCGRIECEDLIKKESARDEPSEPGAPAMGAKTLCIPFKQPKDILPTTKCIHPACNAKPQNYALFGRSY